MKNIKKKILFGATSVFTAAAFLLTATNGTYAEENGATEYEEIEESDEIYSPNGRLYNGDFKALIVRVGFSDYPLNETNEYYKNYADDYIKSLYEGRTGGFGLPYNGLFDHLNTSSYGKLNMTIGGIVDVQLDNSLESYIGEYSVINFYEIDEFCEKLYSKINVEDYDSNGDGIIDALYLWNFTGDSMGEAWGYCYGVFDENYKEKLFVAIFFPDYVLEDDKRLLNVLIHETGHLLRLPDYYALPDYPRSVPRADIGNIMGWAGTEKGDYDAISKWKQGWLSSENVTVIDLVNSEKGRVELTPYDQTQMKERK